MPMSNLERWAVGANIVRFEELLKSAKEESRRKLLEQLLQREHEKLAAFNRKD